MRPRISLTTNFACPGTEGEGFDLPPGVNTVRDLLKHVGEKVDFAFINPDTKEIEVDLEIAINDKAIWFFPKGLDTPLSDGDSVDISLIPLGGG
ncbi:MAG: MoaD/ThiS family protein [Deltaproteobacteria bacterium]|nr:MoaD/ThiS family protein [Deltaproteobacteria bacterium]